MEKVPRYPVRHEFLRKEPYVGLSFLFYLSPQILLTSLYYMGISGRYDAASQFGKALIHTESWKA